MRIQLNLILSLIFFSCNGPVHVDEDEYSNVEDTTRSYPTILDDQYDVIYDDVEEALEMPKFVKRFNAPDDLDTLPIELLQCENLEVLDLSRTRIRELPNWIGRFNNLTELNIRWNPGFRPLPDSISSLSNLEKFDATNTGLSKLPSNFNRLQKLKELYLDHNSFTSIPSVLCELSSLSRLHLYNNEISTYPDCIGELTSLTELDLVENKLTKKQQKELEYWLPNTQIIFNHDF